MARWLAVMWIALGAGPVAAQPETRGTFAIEEWDAGRVMVAGTSIRTRVLFPATAPGPFPLVAVVHGYARDGSYHLEMARTLASRGMVAIVPDMPCGLAGCNHDANARQLSALLDWAVAQSGDAASMIAGKVDGERRGLIGHSFGALNSFLAAASDPTIDSVVLLDPNDDFGVGLDATPMIDAPVLQLIAEVEGSCNSAWRENEVHPMLPPPKLLLTVVRSGHCDPEDPTDSACAFACRAGDEATTPLFRRYAVAWTACILSADASMTEWVGGGRMMDDESAGRIAGVMRDGLDALPCRGAPPMRDAGPIARVDAGPRPDGSPPDPDAGPPSGRIDAGPRPMGATEDGGNGCLVPGGRENLRDRSAVTAGMMAGVMVALMMRRRRRA